jgi:RNA polymerase sigma-70 factor (ECF subfamily)
MRGPRHEPTTVLRYDARKVSDAGTVTRLLRDWRGGDNAARDALIPMIYAELHKLAAGYLRGERSPTFQPTELVSEAYLRLADGQPDWNDRAHFFGIAARTMRQILVDHARKRNAVKRGDGDRPVTLDESAVAADRPEAMIALDEALDALEKVDERKARTIELAYFGGMTQPEIAEAIGVHVNTVARDQRLAEAWIHRFLRG